MKKIASAFIVLCLSFAGCAYWSYDQINQYMNAPILVNEKALVQVAEGANYQSFTRYLVEQKIIEPSIWSRWAVKLYPELTQIKAGTYQVNANDSLKDVFKHVSTGKEHQFSITFIEGSTFKEWRSQLEKVDYLRIETKDLSESELAKALGLEHDKLEGLFLPETYHYAAGDSDLDILQRAANHMQKTLTAAWAEKPENLPLATPYELLTLASIIEKETAVDDERDKVASVFINRLNKKMRLQTDPTVIYGMGEHYNGNITRKDLRTPTPYNTYVINGLPPTPIAMPSQASIQAVVKPADTQYFYFVADGKGGHVFSNTLKQHNRAVQAYLKVLREKK